MADKLTRRSALAALAAAPTLGLANGTAVQDEKLRLLGDSCTAYTALFDAFYASLMSSELVRLHRQMVSIQQPLSELRMAMVQVMEGSQWVQQASPQEQQTARVTAGSLTTILDNLHQMIDITRSDGELTGQTRREPPRLTAEQIRQVANQSSLTKQLFDQALRGLLEARFAVERIQGARAVPINLPSVLHDGGAKLIGLKGEAWPDLLEFAATLRDFEKQLNKIDLPLQGLKQEYTAAVSLINSANSLNASRVYDAKLVTIGDKVLALAPDDTVRAQLDIPVRVMTSLPKGLETPQELFASIDGGAPTNYSAASIKQIIRDKCGIAGYAPSDIQVRCVGVCVNLSVLVFDQEDRAYALATGIYYLLPQLSMVKPRFTTARSIARTILGLA